MPSGVWRIALTFSFLFALTIGAFFLHFESWRNSALGVSAPQVLSFKAGSSLNSLIVQLQDRKLLLGAYESVYFKVLAWQMNVATQLQAGEYQLSSAMTAEELLVQMAEGRVVTYTVEITDGITTNALLAQLQRDSRLQALSSLKNSDDLLRLLDLQTPFVEGVFLPETYQIRRGDSVASVLQRAHQALLDELNLAWTSRQFESPISTPEELLILASIIEKETGLEAERATISQVFHLRLVKNMRLQTDPTVIYALGESFDGDIRRKDLRVDSPYNTYRYKGLPPTPIALPSRRAIQAAAAPSDGNYLYFVARGDGSSYFSQTLAEHNRAVAKFQLGRE